MNTLILILSSIVFVLFFIKQRIEYKRFKHESNLSILYEKMEMHFIQKDITLTNSYVEFLKIFKNLSVNPGYLDIQILILHKLISDHKGSLNNDLDWFDTTLNYLDEDFQNILKAFDENTLEIIRLSFFKPDVVFFVFTSLIQYQLNLGANAFKNFWKDIKFVQEHDQVVSYAGLKLSNHS